MRVIDAASRQTSRRRLPTSKHSRKSLLSLGSKEGAEASFQEDFKKELAGCGGLFFQTGGHTGEVCDGVKWPRGGARDEIWVSERGQGRSLAAEDGCKESRWQQGESGIRQIHLFIQIGDQCSDHLFFLPLVKAGFPATNDMRWPNTTSANPGQRKWAGVSEPPVLTALGRTPSSTQGHGNEPELRVAGFMVTRG